MSMPFSRRRVLPVAGLTVIALAAGLPTVAANDTASRTGFFELAPTAAEVPGGGDPHGNVRAFLQLDGPRNSVCYLISWAGLKGKVTAAHLHKAVAGKTGPHHIDLLNDAAISGKRGSAAACVDADEAHGHGMAPDPRAVRAVLKNPDRFYLNLHSSAFPDGARRAQLG